MKEKLEKLRVGKIIYNEPMSKHTTYKIGGNVFCIVYPNNIENLTKLMKFIKENNLKYKVIGNGSNLIFTDEYYDGIIVNLKEFDNLEINGTVVRVGAGYNLMKLAQKVAKYGLTGLEFAAGIPGTVGGAVYMNAGAYNTDMGYIVSEILVLTPDLQVKKMYNRDLDYHYRDSFLQRNPGYICLEATLVLKRGNADAIKTLMEDRKQRRLLTQPLEYPSAGSVFRNPKDDFAGRIIEELGFKGKSIGGAKVSEKHANFIINTGNATFNDVKTLIELIQKEVKEKYNIELKVEQEFVE